MNLTFKMLRKKSLDNYNMTTDIDYYVTNLLDIIILLMIITHA